MQRAPIHGAGQGAATCVCAVVLAVLALAGCGGAGSSTSTVTVGGVPASPAASARATVASTGAGGTAVAYVAGTPISKSAYAHWLSVEQKLGGSAGASHRALGFLITSQWVVDEAAHRHVNVSEADVKQRYEHVAHQGFARGSSLSKFMATSGETEADLLARIRVELLVQRIAAQVAVASGASRRQAALTGFQQRFHVHWKALTSCESGYVMEDCRQYRGGPENLTATASHGAASAAGTAGRHSSSAASTSGSSASSPSKVSGEVYSTPGGFGVTSSAFGRNGAVPSQYTCAGAGTSPPLSWERVPTGAAELVLFVIDDSSNGSSGGIRWIVGGIDPTSTGVAAGSVPAGGIVGTNTAGKASYSPICPAAGHSDTVEVVVYALKKRIPLSPGFQPAVAEHEYGAGNLILGQAAVTYGVASR